ncbi:MAG: hypothetical protein R3F30_06440 [Planctomycetota bacterium]
MKGSPLFLTLAMAPLAAGSDSDPGPQPNVAEDLQRPSGAVASATAYKEAELYWDSSIWNDPATGFRVRKVVLWHSSETEQARQKEYLDLEDAGLTPMAMPFAEYLDRMLNPERRYLPYLDSLRRDIRDKGFQGQQPGAF